MEAGLIVVIAIIVLRLEFQRRGPKDTMASTQPRKRVFRQFKYRGIDLSQLVGLTVTQRMDELLEIMPARVHRKFKKGVKPAQLALLKKLLKKKKECKEID